ncbi:MAG: PBP1A family penicillin-binding protein [Acidobacteria bacterium]|nr:PBP1A family penicillin-binding protein [Acidobacteriota bacterium]
MKVKVRPEARLARFVLGPVGRILLVSAALCMLAGAGVFTYYYAKYSRLIDQKLRSGPFAQTSKIFAAPRTVAVGDPATLDEIVAELRRTGYSEARANPIGHYHLRADAVEVFPGPDSYFDQNEPGVIKIAGGKISQIVSLADNTERNEFQLEPQLITNLFDRNREKRRIIRFADIPQVLVDAVTSAEDKRFFQHAGFDPIRIFKAIYVDVKEGRKEQGASTLSQQLARGLWLNPDKRWTRKLAEAIITLQLEQKLSKQEIFEDYANQIYLGWRGGFRIHGFGEAAEVYFGKDIRQLTVPEAATLAGMIQKPSWYDPFRHPDRMLERRNVILGLMRQNGHISDVDYQKAVAAPLNLARGATQSVDAPYFVDLVNETLQNMFQDLDFQANSFRVYTTLDMDLQRAAMEAVRVGMPLVDEQLKRQRRFRGQPLPNAQVALVALDPHTGEVKALVGGRNYGMSQLNRALAKRQPGSIFKPFVYATALDTAVEGGPHILTAGTTVLDEPTTFWYDNKPYEPSNFKHEFYGTVTLRQALAHSMNVATVKVAEMVGYDNVVAMARRAGLNYDIHPTPAVALGAYEVTPLEMAGAYTMFADQGSYLKPSYISFVRDNNGKSIFANKVEKKKALDPRVAYLMTNLMEEVMRSGTAAGVRARGFTVPAAGKTGTSRDGWFAGYTSQLLCVVWVGFDDNRELNLEGAHSALPIWTEFMKRALEHRAYRNAMPFVPPDGIVTVQIDPASGMPATASCPLTRTEVYIAGTQPVGSCPLHGGQAVTNVAGWDTQAAPQQQIEPPPVIPSRVGQPPVLARQGADPPAAAASQPEKPKEKKGFFHRIWGVFK